MLLAVKASSYSSIYLLTTMAHNDFDMLLHHQENPLSDPITVTLLTLLLLIVSISEPVHSHSIIMDNKKVAIIIPKKAQITIENDVKTASDVNATLKAASSDIVRPVVDTGTQQNNPKQGIPIQFDLKVT